MNAPTPVDPDKLRARLGKAVEPVTPSPDALIRIKAGARRRRRLQWSFGSGAGVLALAGATAAVMGVASLGHPDAAPHPVQPGYSPTAVATTSPAPPPSLTVRPTASEVPSLAGVTSVAANPGSAVVLSASTATRPLAAASSAATTSATVTSAAVTSAAATSAAVVSVADDVDHDGKPDTATLERTGTQAKVVVHLAGRTVTSAPFRLSLGAGAGRVTFVSVNRDGRSEIIVSGFAASAEPYYLFQYAGGAVTEVPAPAGMSEPWLVSGGGMNVDLTFGCTASGLVLSTAAPKSLTDFNASTASYVYSSTTYRFQGDVLVKIAASARTGLMRSEALALAASQPSNRCGAPM